MSGTGLPDLVALAYDCACDADGMKEFIKNAAEYFGAPKAAIGMWPNDKADAFIPVTAGISNEEFSGLFAERFRRDTLFGQLCSLPSGEAFVIDSAIGTTDDRAGTDRIPRHNEATTWNVLAGVVLADEDNRCVMALFRDKEHGEFSDLETGALQSLMGYFRRAIAINKRFVSIFTELRSVLAILESAPRGIFIFGQKQQVTYQNTAARQMVAQSDGLTLDDNVLHIYDDRAKKVVSDFLDNARDNGDRPITLTQLSTSVARPSNRAPFQAMIYTVPFNKSQAAFNKDETLATMVIYDPTSGPDLKVEVLENIYKLSGAEARLAQALYTGRRLPEAADSLGISINTARTQLRGVFKKVGVKSQSALMQEFAQGIKSP